MAAVLPGAGSGVLPPGIIVDAARVPRFSCLPILDEAHALLSQGKIVAGMDLLMDRLSDLRKEVGPEEWEALLHAELVHHPIGRIIWQDPFTSHSYRKPRGYPGDAMLLDYIYGYQPPPPDTTSIGQTILQFNRDRQAPRSVRSRAQVLAEMIDRTAEEFISPRILSIACGHLREAGKSQAVMSGRIGEFLALDQDAESLAQVRRAFGDKGVKTVESSIRGILTGKVTFNDLHFVYAAGLYDYLAERVASRLTRLMFDMLVPGGRLLVANFTPRLADIGYIESYMGWKLIYREPEQMTALARDIASSEWHSHRLFWDEHESIIFLEIIKRRRPTITFGPGANGATVPGLKNVTIAPEPVPNRAGKQRDSNGNGHNGNGHNGNGHNGNGNNGNGHNGHGSGT